MALDMARRRKRGLRPWVGATLTGIAVTAGLACLILLANDVTLLRTEIGDLGQKRTTLVVRKAMLMARWNTAAAQGAVVARATEELGLLCPADPGHVLVLTDARPVARSRSSGVASSRRSAAARTWPWPRRRERVREPAPPADGHPDRRGGRRGRPERAAGPGAGRPARELPADRAGPVDRFGAAGAPARRPLRPRGSSARAVGHLDAHRRLHEAGARSAAARRRRWPAVLGDDAAQHRAPHRRRARRPPGAAASRPSSSRSSRRRCAASRR